MRQSFERQIKLGHCSRWGGGGGHTLIMATLILLMPTGQGRLNVFSLGERGAKSPECTNGAHADYHQCVNHKRTGPFTVGGGGAHTFLARFAQNSESSLPNICLNYTRIPPGSRTPMASIVSSL